MPHLKRCGYADAQMVRPFRVGNVDIDLAAFAGQPWDNWSACLAAVNLEGDSKESASKVKGFGAVSVFVCGPLGVDWWGMGPNGPTASRPIKWSEIDGVFREHKDELAPQTIYDAKLRRPSAKPVQMWFFDAGLMPAVERNRGQTLLRLVENAIGGLSKEFGARLNSKQAQEDAYRTVFWQLAAKVLHDKGVPNFIKINLKDVDEVFDRIGKHHGETRRLPPFGKDGRLAIDAMAAAIADCGSLADVSSESIGYVYENALLDKAAGNGKRGGAGKPYDIRKELGIHSTPLELIHHMLAQVWGMVEEIPIADRVVFEPACGHAPFLTGAMRWLRSWDASGAGITDHEYMRKHTRGLEKEPFSIELARLNLTLADEPHGNSWAIAQGDMFEPGVLAREAKKARILLSNPPYEAFTDAQRRQYAKDGERVTANTKAVEMLNRTLPYLSAGSVFGVVMPVGVLHDKESKDIREELLKECDLSEISVFADNLFEHGDHEVAVLMGRKKKPRSKPPTLMYRRVREAGMAAFKDRLAFSWERKISPSRFVQDEDADLRVPELDELWKYLASSPQLSAVASVRQGASLHTDRQAVVEKRDPDSCPKDAVPAIVSRYRDVGIADLPTRAWIYRDRRDVLHWRGGTYMGQPQVLLNYASQSRTAWRLKAFYDARGHATTNKYTTIRPTDARLSVVALWGIMNSPVANGFAHCASLKRHTFDGLLRSMPIPEPFSPSWNEIEAAASQYRNIVTRKMGPRAGSASLFDRNERTTVPVPTDAEVHAALLAMDSAVLRAYDLPPRLERQLLELFSGVERKGVGLDGPDGHSTFLGYYPPGFTSALPLHLVISEQFKRAAADKTAERMRPGESAYVREVLSAASAGTEEA